MDVQALSHRLHPSVLGYVGVVSASAAFCRELAERQHVDVAFSHDGIPDGLQANVARSVFRVLQEAVTNAVKHAGVSRVAVALCGSPDAIRLDLGRRRRLRSGHRCEWPVEWDWSACRSVRALGGELFIESRPGAGTSIRARVPIWRPRSASRLDG
jgi:signal transduction histidine kinase